MAAVDRIIGMVPVDKRIIEPDFQAFSPESIYKLPDYIPSERCVCRLIISVFGIPQTESLVVLRRQNNILHSGFLCTFRPFLGIIKVRIKSLEILLVVLRCDPFTVLHPFMTGRKGIQSPVDEHSEPCVGPPLHPLYFLCFRLFGKLG